MVGYEPQTSKVPCKYKKTFVYDRDVVLIKYIRS